jgi:hypothetical protein
MRDGEGCRHAEMGYGGLPAEAGDDEREEVVVCRPLSASPGMGHESLPAWFLSRSRHGGSHSLHNLSGTYT